MKPTFMLRGGEKDRPKKIGWWLVLCTLLSLGMIVLGALTRLTQSGLSIVDWKPVTAWLPPMNDVAWQAAFDAYKQFPEYQRVNFSMDLAGYKSIYWLEYAHRLLGRIIGFVFAIPMFWWWSRGVLPRFLRGRMLGLLVLGGMQGFVGWFMVQSGLVDVPHVSAYRLTIHLLLATFLFAGLWWSALDVFFPESYSVNKSTRNRACVFLLLVWTTITAGGLVAGNRAGLIMADWPTMGGQWIPDGLVSMTPLWRNLLDNIITIQFQHRMLAYCVVLFAIFQFWTMVRDGVHGRITRLGFFVVLAVLVQVSLGVGTLLLGVTPAIAACHQGMGMLVLAVSLMLCHRMSSP